MKSISPSKQIYTFIIDDVPETTTFFIDILDSKYTYLNFKEYLKATRAICDTIIDLKISMIDDIKDTDGKRLCFIHNKSMPLDDYVNTLKVRCEKYKAGETFTLITEEIYFAENMLHDSMSLHRKKVDVWWDFENNVMFMFGKKRANTVLKAIRKAHNKLYNVVHELELKDCTNNWLTMYNNRWLPGWNYCDFRNVFKIDKDDLTKPKIDTECVRILQCFSKNGQYCFYNIHYFSHIRNDELILCSIDPRTKNKCNHFGVDIIEFCEKVKNQVYILLTPK